MLIAGDLPAAHPELAWNAGLSRRSQGLVMPILDESRPSPAINISDTLH
jgi:hypothetical protein